MKNNMWARIPSSNVSEEADDDKCFPDTSNQVWTVDESLFLKMESQKEFVPNDDRVYSFDHFLFSTTRKDETFTQRP